MITFFYKNNPIGWWILVMVLGGVLRLFFLSQGEITGDEPMYSVRSQGWIDTLGSTQQTTPYDWFVITPAWVNWSFHDHPPLVFAVQWLAQEFFGSGMLSARLASVFFDFLGAILIYGIGKQISNQKFALTASVLYMVNVVAIGFARLALMETITQTIILLVFFCLFKSLSERIFLKWFGLAVGLSILSKYVALFFLPLYFFIFFRFAKDIFFDKRLYATIGLGLVIISPVIAYNFNLYQTVGHFDVQIASLLKQNTPEWLVLLGKEQRGDLVDRVLGLVNVTRVFSPWLLFLMIFYFFYQRILKKETDQPLFAAIGYGGIITVIFLCLISGTAVRFLYYFTPFFIFFAAEAILILDKFFQKKYFLFIFVTAEIIYTTNTIIVPIIRAEPFGQPIIAFAPGLTVYNQGIGALDNFMEKELFGLSSAIPAKPEKPALKAAAEKYYLNFSNSGVFTPVVILYDSEMEIQAQTQILLRRTLYQGWPVAEINQVEKVADTLSKTYPTTTVFYINSMPKNTTVLAIPVTSSTPKLSIRVAELMEQKSYPRTEIKRHDGTTAFEVYRLSVKQLTEAVNKIKVEK